MREGKGGRGGQMRVQTRESGKSGWEKWWCGLRVDVLACVWVLMSRCWAQV